MTLACYRIGARVDAGYREGDTRGMDTPTRGAEALRKYLAEPGRSQVALAAALHCGQPAIAAWVAGRTRPTPPLRESLELVDVCPASWWETPEERAQVERVRAGLVPPTVDGAS